MMALKIAIYALIPLCISLSGCGRKLAPKPAEGSEITYPGRYPNPNCD
ncbi:MAG TPA: hypothetical protein VMW10_13045 [Alphaproteobacteria bacterium]|nr:hypothetical protein [Alphaproteobacteria bacterium]